MGISNNIKVDVVLSGENSTNVGCPLNKNVSVILGGQQNVAINRKLDPSITIGEPDSKVSIAFGGFQGIPGDSVFAKGNDGSIQYNRLGYVSGAQNFFFFPEAKDVLLKNGSFILEDGIFEISGSEIHANKFIVKDLDDTSKSLLKIDPTTKTITFAENSADYYVGISIENPTEKLHISGNLKVEGDIYLRGDLLPITSNQSSLGSPTKSFKELYLAGESINFAGTEAKISASKNGFNFFIEKLENDEISLTKVFTVTTGINGGIVKNTTVSGDGSLLTGVPYKELKDNGIFIEEIIPINSFELVINYGETLPYTPKVICAVVPPINSNEFYFVSVENITSSSCKAVFSNKILTNNFKINCFISPNDL